MEIIVTRINILPVECLTDQHLVAEYKEITRPFTKMRHRMQTNNTDFTTTEDYVLGSGHETFFFDKLEFLFKRYQALATEMLNRDMNVDIAKFSEVYTDLANNFKHTQFWNDWQPTPREIYLNMARLCRRSKLTNVLDELQSDA